MKKYTLNLKRIFITNAENAVTKQNINCLISNFKFPDKYKTDKTIPLIVTNHNNMYDNPPVNKDARNDAKNNISFVRSGSTMLFWIYR